MKTTAFGITTLALASWSMAAAAQTTGVGVASGNLPSSAASINASASLSQADKDFVNAAARAGLSEVMAGQLAEQKGDPAVQRVGKRMVADHTKANDTLKRYAQNLGMSVPTGPTSEQQAEYDRLQNVSGAAFDKAYLADQRQAHETAISLFNAEAASGRNATLKRFAVQTLPMLRAHLAMIEQAQGTAKATQS